MYQTAAKASDWLWLLSTVIRIPDPVSALERVGSDGCCSAAQLLGGEGELAGAVAWLEANLNVDVDARIHVFELTIRALGAHCLCTPHPPS